MEFVITVTVSAKEGDHGLFQPLMPQDTLDLLENSLETF